MAISHILKGTIRTAGVFVSSKCAPRESGVSVARRSEILKYHILNPVFMHDRGLWIPINPSFVLLMQLVRAMKRLFVH